jgi:hypothetical protein
MLCRHLARGRLAGSSCMKTYESHGNVVQASLHAGVYYEVGTEACSAVMQHAPCVVHQCTWEQHPVQLFEIHWYDCV